MIKNIIYFVEQSWLLISASFVFALLLAVTNAAWQPRIQQNQRDKFNNLAAGMLRDAVNFETTLQDFEIETGKGKKIKTDIKKALSADKQCVGWAFVCEGPGFADKIKIVLTVDAKFEKLKGFGVLASNETPGFGDKIKNDYFRSQFPGAPAGELTLSKTGDYKKTDSEIIAITGATVSSEAVVKILNSFIEQVKGRLQKDGLIGNGK